MRHMSINYYYSQQLIVIHWLHELLNDGDDICLVNVHLIIETVFLTHRHIQKSTYTRTQTRERKYHSSIYQKKKLVFLFVECFHSNRFMFMICDGFLDSFKQSVEIFLSWLFIHLTYININISRWITFVELNFVRMRESCMSRMFWKVYHNFSSLKILRSFGYALTMFSKIVVREVFFIYVENWDDVTLTGDEQTLKIEKDFMMHFWEHTRH